MVDSKFIEDPKGKEDGEEGTGAAEDIIEGGEEASNPEEPFGVEHEDYNPESKATNSPPDEKLVTDEPTVEDVVNENELEDIINEAAKEVKAEEEAAKAETETAETKTTPKSQFINETTKEEDIGVDNVLFRAIIASLHSENGKMSPSTLTDLAKSLDFSSISNLQGGKLTKIGYGFKKASKIYKKSLNKLIRKHKRDENAEYLDQLLAEQKTDTQLFKKIFCRKQEGETDEDVKNKKRAYDQQVQGMFENGFQIKTKSGITIAVQKDNKGNLSITTMDTKRFGRKNRFNQEAANAIIDIAVVGGWKDLTLHGTSKHKDMLWRAIQEKNIMEEAAFNQAEADRKAKEGDSFVPKKFEPIKCYDANGQPYTCQTPKIAQEIAELHQQELETDEDEPSVKKAEEEIPSATEEPPSATEEEPKAEDAPSTSTPPKPPTP